MIGLTLLRALYTVAIVAVAGDLVLEGFRRLSRCCMSARTVIAAIAREDQPQTFEQIVQHLIDDDHTETIKEAGRVQ